MASTLYRYYSARLPIGALCNVNCDAQSTVSPGKRNQQTAPGRKGGKYRDDSNAVASRAVRWEWFTQTDRLDNEIIKARVRRQPFFFLCFSDDPNKKDNQRGNKPSVAVRGSTFRGSLSPHSRLCRQDNHGRGKIRESSLADARETSQSFPAIARATSLKTFNP